jgi:hypothetical protein
MLPGLPDPGALCAISSQNHTESGPFTECRKIHVLTDPTASHSHFATVSSRTRSVTIVQFEKQTPGLGKSNSRKAGNQSNKNGRKCDSNITIKQ